MSIRQIVGQLGSQLRSNLAKAPVHSEAVKDPQITGHSVVLFLWILEGHGVAIYRRSHGMNRVPFPLLLHVCGVVWM